MGDHDERVPDDLDDLDSTPASRVEVTADVRAAAAGVWQLYNALTNEGFVERQALYLLGTMLAAGVQKGE